MAYEGIRQIQKTSTACAGASTAFVITHVCIQAGAYVPSLQDAIVRELHLDKHGARLREDVYPWLEQNRLGLSPMGLRWQLTPSLVDQPMTTGDLIAWVKVGGGRHGAVVGLDPATLYAGSTSADGHAVGLVFSTDEQDGREGVVLVDPWPTLPQQTRPPPSIHAARVRFPDVLLLSC